MAHGEPKEAREERDRRDARRRQLVIRLGFALIGIGVAMFLVNADAAWILVGAGFASIGTMLTWFPPTRPR